MTIVPAPRPCVSCPYRRDVPSGIWSRQEYEKLPPFDNETGFQPPSAFFCHQQDGRLCAGWVGTHDMDDSLGLRMVASLGMASEEELDAVRSYKTDVPLFSSGAEAAEHGLRDIDDPDFRARLTVDKLRRKRARTES